MLKVINVINLLNSYAEFLSVCYDSKPHSVALLVRSPMLTCVSTLVKMDIGYSDFICNFGKCTLVTKYLPYR